MNWQFDSLAALMQMDGHGAFVWSAYGITALVLAILLVAPLNRRKRLLSEIRGEQRRQKAAEEAHASRS